MSRHTPTPKDRSLRVSEKFLNAFNRELGSQIAKSLAFEDQRHLIVQKLEELPGSSEVNYGLVESNAGLTALDDRRTQQPVIHFHSSPSMQQHLLLAIKFSWKRVVCEFRFSEAQVLVFLAWGDVRAARTPEVNRRQLLRLEWEGVDARGDFEAGIAAHPHWHMDQWLAGHDVERAQAEQRLNRDDSLREFGAHPSGAPPPDVRWMRSIHLAAAAKWAATPWQTDGDCTMHATSPEDLSALRNWTLSSIRYISHQFGEAIERAR